MTIENNRKRTKPITVLEFTTGLTIGGTEKMLLSLVKGMDKTEFKVIVGCLTQDMEIGRLMREAGIEVFCLNAKNKWDVSVIWKLAKIIRNKKVDILHSYLIHASIIGRLAAIISNVPICIVGKRDVDLHFRWHERMLDKWTSFAVDEYIALSAAAKKYLQEQVGVQPGRISVVYNGLDVDNFKCRKNPSEVKVDYNIPGDRLVLGCVSRLVPPKGHEYLVCALSILKKKYHMNPVLVIVGDGICRPRLEKLVNEKELQNDVIFTGKVLYPQELISTFDIFILPSLSEGFGIVLLEAMALSKPIVATRIDGIKEVVVDGETGILVPPADSEALAAAINQLMKDKSQAECYALAGNKRLVKYFTLDQMIHQVEAIYLKQFQKNNYREN